jgi:hypothetical protein
MPQNFLPEAAQAARAKGFSYQFFQCDRLHFFEQKGKKPFESGHETRI